MIEPAQVNEALLYARNYEGAFPFMVAMRQRVLDSRTFTAGQIQAILNSKAAREEVREIVHETYGVIDLRTNVPPGRTRHAITRGPGAPVTFYHVDSVVKGKWAGNVFVREVQGAKLSSENTGRQRPGELYKGHRYADMARIVLDATLTMGEYGRLIGKCALCSKTLTDDVSRKVGIGPKCLSRSIKRGER